MMERRGDSEEEAGETRERVKREKMREMMTRRRRSIFDR